MEVIGDELVEAFHGVVGDVEEDGSLVELGALADEVDGELVVLEEWGEERGDEGLGEYVGEWERGEERDESGDEGGVLRGLDDEGELHGGLGHFNGGGGGGVESAVDDVGPVDEVGEGGGVEAEVGLGDVGDVGGAGGVGGVNEFGELGGREWLAGGGELGAVEVSAVSGSEEGGEVVVEPPGEVGGW